MTGFRPWMIALLAAPLAAFADVGDGAASDPVITAVQAAVAAGDYRKAAEAARGGLARSPGNANYHNLFAFALRKAPDSDMNLVFRHYHEALRLDPGHRGAHEYIGEAYLAVGNLAKAREHLARLDDLCFFGCQEYTDLKRAVAAYEGRSAR